MSQHHPIDGADADPVAAAPGLRPGVYAWDERDAGSIASHTDSYRSNLFVVPATSEETLPRPGLNRGSFAMPARIAARMIARIRSRPQPDVRSA